MYHSRIPSFKVNSKLSLAVNFVALSRPDAGRGVDFWRVLKGLAVVWTFDSGLRGVLLDISKIQERGSCCYQNPKREYQGIISELVLVPGE